MTGAAAQDGAARFAALGWPARLAGGLCAALWLADLLVAPTLGIGWIDSWHNEQRAIEIVLLSLTPLLLAVALCDPLFRARLPPVHWTVPAFFALGVASAASARHAGAADAEVALHLLLLLLLLFSAGICAADPPAALRWLRRAARLLLAVYVAGVAVRYAAAVAIGQPLDQFVLLLGYANIRHPSALHALLIPLAATWDADGEPSPLARTANWSLLACVWAINLALGTRAIWFAFAIGFALLWPLLGRRAIAPLVRVLAGTAAAGVVLYVLVFKFLPVWIGIGETFAARDLDQLAWGSNRELLLRSSWEAIRAAPWLGIGPMQFAAIPGVWAAHPHDWILQVASEWGLPALLLLLAGMLGFFWRALRLYSRLPAQGPAPAPADLATLLVVGTVALVYGLVDGSLVMPISQSAAAILLGTLLGFVSAADPAAPPAAGGKRVARVRMGLAAILTAVAIVELGRYAIDTLPAATASEDAQHFVQTRVLWPRFWSDGLLPVEP
jgi:O-antigen ligase